MSLQVGHRQTCLSDFGQVASTAFAHLCLTSCIWSYLLQFLTILKASAPFPGLLTSCVTPDLAYLFWLESTEREFQPSPSDGEDTRNYLQQEL
jgi:hypothetical protein